MMSPSDRKRAADTDQSSVEPDRKRRALSPEQKTFIQGATGVKPGKWYQYTKVAPTRELRKSEVFSALEEIIHNINYVQENDNAFESNTKLKASDSKDMVDLIKDLITTYNSENGDKEKRYKNEEQRYYSYDLGNKIIGIAVTTQNTDNMNEIYIESIVSNIGVRGLASAILEEIMKSCPGNPDIKLSSLHGSIGLYRNLSFMPDNEEEFTKTNIMEYDKFFLTKKESEIADLPDQQYQIYRRYQSLRLRPHLSDLWEAREGAWHFRPDGDTYLAASVE